MGRFGAPRSRDRSEHEARPIHHHLPRPLVPRARRLRSKKSSSARADIGYDGIEIDGKRPHGNPLDLPRRRCRELRAGAQDAGIEIYAVAANNDFSSPVPEYRESQLLYVRDLIRMTADLGARTLRMFAAWPGRDGLARRRDATPTARRFGAMRTTGCAPSRPGSGAGDGLAESARLAGDAGVTLALQNHAPVTNSPATCSG